DPQAGVVVGFAVAKGTPAAVLGKAPHIVQQGYCGGNAGLLRRQPLANGKQLHDGAYLVGMFDLEEDVFEPFGISIAKGVDIAVEPLSNGVQPGLLHDYSGTSGCVEINEIILYLVAKSIFPD